MMNLTKWGSGKSAGVMRKALGLMAIGGWLWAGGLAGL